MRRTRVNLSAAIAATFICALITAGSAGAHATAQRPFKCSTANICKVSRIVDSRSSESNAVSATSGCKSRWIKHTGENAAGIVLFWIKDTTRWCYGPRVYDDSCIQTHATYYVWHAHDPDKCQAHVAIRPGTRRSHVANVFSEEFAGITAETVSNGICMEYSKGGGWKEGGC